jgi:hypothetical protein
MLSAGRTSAKVCQLSITAASSPLQSSLKHRERSQLLARAMATQTAVRVSQLGGQDQLKPVSDAQIPEPEPGHVTVKNEFGGGNENPDVAIDLTNSRFSREALHCNKRAARITRGQGVEGFVNS